MNEMNRIFDVTEEAEEYVKNFDNGITPGEVTMNLKNFKLKGRVWPDLVICLSLNLVEFVRNLVTEITEFDQI